MANTITIEKTRQGHPVTIVGFEVLDGREVLCVCRTERCARRIKEALEQTRDRDSV